MTYQTVADFIDSRHDAQKELFVLLDQWLCSFPGVQAKIRYNIPFYYGKSWIWYLNPIKTDAVELCFLRGNELNDTSGLLDFRGRKQIRGIILHQMDQLEELPIQPLMEQAYDLDQRIPYQSPWHKKKPAR